MRFIFGLSWLDERCFGLVRQKNADLRKYLAERDLRTAKLA
jgi:hypothetical protein